MAGVWEMNLNRRELKFQIPQSLVEPICRYMEPYCEMDKYSQIAPDHYYTINSLYLDNDQMLLLERKRLNLPRRFSMRIRSYGKRATFPAFMEIKGKQDMFIHKRRTIMTSMDTIGYLRDGHAEPGNPDIHNSTMSAACYYILKHGLSPRIMTQYQRMAFMGRFDVYSRVTFDRRMRCYPESDYAIFPDPEKFKNYDHIDQYDAPGANIVLELKCELKVPGWMQEMIRRFELKQAQFSKYDSSWTFLELPEELAFLEALK
jgi:SPX domain protein involved in polyphosphate accumulation